MAESLQNKAFWAAIWSVCGGFMNEIVRFVIGLVLARLLMPEDYGLVGMLTIFIAIATCIVDGGMSNALVRKPDYTNVDLSTVFYYNLAVAVSLYLILYIAAPYIAEFYGHGILCELIRILCIIIVMGALEEILKVQLFININFKLLNAIKIAGALFGGTVGILAAYQGYGVWSLVAMQLAGSTWRIIHAWFIVRWKPVWAFSRSAFKQFFSFGSKLLIANIINSAYNNINQMFIGKIYSSASLGYYTRASQYAELPAMTLTWGIGSVAYPIMCRFQHDRQELVRLYLKSIRLTCILVFPCLLGVAAVAKPLVLVLLTEKWLPSVYLLQILCFAFIWYPLNALIMNILQVVGRSDLCLRAEFIKKMIGLGVLLFVIFHGIECVCYGVAFISAVNLIVNSYFSKITMGVGLLTLFKETYSSFVVTGVMFLIVLTFLSLVDCHPAICLFVGCLLGAVSFISIAFACRLQSFREAWIILSRNVQFGKYNRNL